MPENENHDTNTESNENQVNFHLDHYIAEQILEVLRNRYRYYGMPAVVEAMSRVSAQRVPMAACISARLARQRSEKEGVEVGLLNGDVLHMITDEDVEKVKSTADVVIGVVIDLFLSSPQLGAREYGTPSPQNLMNLQGLTNPYGSGHLVNIHGAATPPNTAFINSNPS